jgi:hypothetical protein
LRDPEAESQKEEGAAMGPKSSESVSKREGVGMSTPSGTEIAEWRRVTETITPAPADPGIPIREFGLSRKEK